VHSLSTTSSKGAKTKEFSGTPIKNKTNCCSLEESPAPGERGGERKKH